MSVHSSVSYLFVPGSREDRFEKAIGSGADRVIIDLEDAVSAEEKDQARRVVCDAIVRGLTSPVLVRVNPADSQWFDDDLSALAHVAATGPGHLAGIVLPKLETTSAVDRARSAITSSPQFEVIGMIESAAGVDALTPLASSGITQFAVGAVDLSVDLGTDIYSPVLDLVYAQTVIASRIAGIAAPIGSPPLDIHAAASTETEARRLKSMGLAGQLCIHPAQIAAVHAGFAPTQEQVEWAQRVLASEGGAAQVDGQMVDKPVRERAERIVAQAERRAS